MKEGKEGRREEKKEGRREAGRKEGTHSSSARDWKLLLRGVRESKMRLCFALDAIRK